MALLDNIVAYWRLDEASGTRADSSGNGRSLTDNGSVGSTTGNISALAADFTPTAQYLSTTDATVCGTIVSASSWTLAGWAWFDADARYSVSGTLGATVTGLNLFRKNTGIWGYQRIAAQMFVSGAVSEREVAVTVAPGSWLYVVTKFDQAGGMFYARVNATTTSGTAPPAGSMTAQSSFRIADRGASSADRMDGRAAHWGIWSRALTGAELDQLYNSGAGLDPTASSQSIVPHLAAHTDWWTR